MDRRKLILKAAEKLFEKNGFDATSVASIAAAAKCNKALIYYHFKDKDDLVHALFTQILDGMREKLNPEVNATDIDLRTKIAAEIGYLAAHRPVLKLLITEALRDGPYSDSLFEFSDIVIEAELRRRGFNPKRPKAGDDALRLVLAHEFFTGIIPVLAFLTLGNRWQKRHGISQESAKTAFMQAFERAHLSTHIEPYTKGVTS